MATIGSKNLFSNQRVFSFWW